MLTQSGYVAVGLPIDAAQVMRDKKRWADRSGKAARRGF